MMMHVVSQEAISAILQKSFSSWGDDDEDDEDAEDDG